MIKWSNLKINKCPKCSKDISSRLNPDTKRFECVCGFKISLVRFEEIVGSMVSGTDRWLDQQEKKRGER